MSSHGDRSSTIIYFTAANQDEESVYALELKESTNVYKQAWHLIALPKDALEKGGDLTPLYQPAQFGDLHPLLTGRR